MNGAVSAVVALVLLAIVAAPVWRWISENAALVAVAAVLLVGAVIAVSMWWSGLAARRRLRRERRIRAALTFAEMSAGQFEHALADLCRRDGCSRVAVVGGAGDLGADVVARAPDGRRIVLQAKRYRVDNWVSGPDLQKFGGTCFAVHGADVAAVVTTAGGFRKQAREYAAHMGIVLVDNHELTAWQTGEGPPPWE
ncbi:restriction endonuclease [Nocardia asteroides]|uniref:restriction endonuclease n=1 Tax=Nocardia asteroides TaxID=1824 RepID=UPI001E5DA78F|nr:restriction endonuclease [Nocardia asteroides]UGT59299.1 restriction endonuclease [Nocardia asteroides]